MKRTDLAYDACTPQFNNTYLSPNLFRFPTRTQNISLFYDCSSYVMSYANYKSLCGSQNNAICFEDTKGSILEQIPELKGCGSHIIAGPAQHKMRPKAHINMRPNMIFRIT
jgi:hypothetical protein